MSIVLFLQLFAVSVSYADVVKLKLETSQREFAVTAIRTQKPDTRAAVIILGGAKGYVSDAYRKLADQLNKTGIDVFLLHYLSHDDQKRMKSASSVHQRIGLYRKRLSRWVEAIQSTIDSQKRKYSKVGFVGISLGAMPVLSYSANNTNIDALVVIDGNFLSNTKPVLKYLPPILLIWGGDDRVFSLRSGLALRDHARSIGGQADLRSFEGRGYAFFLKTEDAKSKSAMSATVEFLAGELLN